MSVEQIREQADVLRKRDQDRKQGLWTRVVNEPLAAAHADYLQRMRSAGDFQCSHPATRREKDQALMVVCQHCDPQR